MATTTTTQQPQLLPPLSVKPSISMQPEDSVFSQLGATPLPDKEINSILNLHENLSLGQVVDHFDTCMDKISRWLNTAQMAIFTLELSLKEDQADFSSFDDNLLALTFNRMEPLMSILIEVGHIVEDKLDMEDNHSIASKKMHTRMSITKIQSEWSGLQHFMSSVLKQLDTMNEKKELTLLMENVLQQIDDLSIMMFQFQEKRHASASATNHHTLDSSESISSPISTTSSLFSPSTTTTATSNTTATTIMSSSTAAPLFNDPMSSATPRDEHILAEIDSKVEPLFSDVQRIYASMTSRPPEDPSGMLTRKHHMVQHRWETLRIEIDDLKEELKEDRWLTVFRQVADQVDVMIDGLDKTVTQCYTMIDQVRDWYGSSAPTSPQHPTSNNAFNRISKTIMRNFPHRHQHSSSSTTTSLPPPVDREKFRSAEKNFEAKYKYYTPSIGKMLGMLGSGIVSRVARDNGTSKRHAAMTQRWSILKTSMDTLRNKDLPETERMLTEGVQSSSMGTSGWRSIRYKSPEPSQGENLIRAKSSTNNTLSKANKGYYHQDLEDYRRKLGGVRSVTPSSGGRTSNKAVTQHPPRAASSMAFARDIRPSASESSSMDYPQHTRRTMTPMSANNYHESRSFATRKSRVPSRDDKEEASWMKPTKSTLMRTARRAQSVDQGMGQQQQQNRPKTPVEIPARSKTPNPGYSRRKSTTPNVPSRPKSSLGRQQQHQLSIPEDHQRSVSPLRRTMTPSLIPRPKTPSSSSIRCASPCLIPRPRSSMQQHPPMPPIPASFQKQPYESHSLKKKQSMPALMHRTTSPFRMTHVPLRAPSPQYRRRRLSEDGNHDFSLMRGQPLNHRQEVYTPNPRDPLDMEVGRIVNASPISVKCQKGPLGGGRYFFGNELNPSVGGGRKMYTCKLMTYDNNNTQRRGKAPAQNKVLVRVGGGWQDLEMFLLDHSNLMTAATSDVGVSRFK